MKKLIPFIGLLFLFLSTIAQNNDKRIVYVEKYDSVLYLYVNPDKYNKMSENNKKEMIKSEADKHSVKMINVINHHKIELWRIYYNDINLVDMWDTNNIDCQMQQKSAETNVVRSLNHPWFFNVSGSIAFKDKWFYANGYSRIGFYLLKGIWDLAVNYMIAYSKEMYNYDDYEVIDCHAVYRPLRSSSNSSFGVDTRVYFPFKKIRFNPFVGLGVSRSSASNNSAWTVPVSVGFSIPTKKGCIDVNYQYDKVIEGTFVVGYTFMLK